MRKINCPPKNGIALPILWFVWVFLLCLNGIASNHILYEFTGDFPGNNPILAAAGVDLGQFTANLELNSNGNATMQSTVLAVSVQSLNDFEFENTEVLVTDVREISITTTGILVDGGFTRTLELIITLNFNQNSESLDLTIPPTQFQSGTISVCVNTASIFGIQCENGTVDTFDATFVEETTGVNQTLDFLPLPVKIFGDNTFVVSATASSGLEVEFSSTNESVSYC